METKQTEISRAIKWVVVPSLFITFLMAFILPEFRTVGILYLVMVSFSLFVFSQRRFKEEVTGIKKGFSGIFYGIIVGAGFLVLSAISPAFSLLTPTLSLTIAENLRFFVLVILGPWVEEIWRSATLAIFHDIYKWTFWKRNIVQAMVFAALHTLVYGITLGAYDSYVQLYGAVLAIGGSLLAAFIFGLISGYAMNKFKSIVPSGIAHQVINFWLVRKGFIVVG